MAIAPRWRHGINLWRGAVHWFAQIRSPFSMGSASHDAESRPARDAHSGDMDLFEAFVHQYERQILNYLWRMTGNEQTAYDLSQETFLRAWQHFATIRAYDQPRAWLFRVASNLAISQLRKHPEPSIDISTLDEDESESTASDPIVHFVESDLVRQILFALSPRRRAALILCEVYGFAAEEVAHVLGMTTGALKMMLSRGREQFRQLYAKETQP
jgi:RNA polymerase sigma-70 factor (ECF subfamily)